MSAQSSIFPAFIRAEYDGSSGGFPAFERDAAGTFSRVEGKAKQFASNFAEIGKVISNAISGGLTSRGGLDLNLGQFRQAASEAKVYEQSLRTMSQAATLLAKETGDTSAATQLYLQALSAQVIEAERASQTADAQVATYTRLQAALDVTAAKNSALAASFREVYSEQAAAAKQEVLQRRYQEGLNANFAPGLTRSATANGAGFGALAQQADEAEAYSRAIAQLRAQIDPLYTAQQRFNSAMDQAEAAFRAGALQEREFAQTTAFLRQQLQDANTAIHASDAAFARSVRASGAARFAFIQTGAQLQDLTVSLIGGQRAGVVFAQQLPQLAFALSGLGMQADGTQKGIGRLATVLSGPWSVVLAGAAYAVGTLVEALFKSSDSSKDAQKSNIDFTNSLSTSRGFITDYANAINQLSSATQGLINTQALLVDSLRSTAKTTVSGLQSQFDNVSQRLTTLRKNRIGLPGSFDTSDVEIAKLERQRAEIARNLESARTSYSQAQAAFEARQAKEGADPDTKARAEIERERAKLTQLRQETIRQGAVPIAGFQTISASQFQQRITALEAREKALSEGKGRGSGVSVLNAQAQFNTADEPLEKARAQLALTKATNKALLDQGKISREAYQARVQSASVEVERQEAIAKSSRASGRTAAADQREFEQALASVTKQFDPARAAAQEYADTLAEIDKVLKRGAISSTEADAFRDFASRRAVDKQSAILTSQLTGVATRSPEDITNGILAELDQEIRKVWDGIAEDSRKVYDNLQLAGDGIARVFGRGAARTIFDIGSRAANDNPNSDLARLVSGIGAAQEQYLNKFVRSLGDLFSNTFDPDKLGAAFGEALGAAGTGIMAGNLAFGSGNSKVGSGIGGAIGNELGKKLGSSVFGKSLGALGNALGPLGSLAGGVLGGAIGGLFTSTKKASATIGGNSVGDLVISSLTGNSGSRKKASTEGANTTISSIERIAEQLGGTVNAGAGSVSIGVRKGNYRVDTSGQGRTKMKAGVLDFGSDAEAAVKAATLDLIQDGVISGLRAGTQKLLQSGTDLEAALDKALKFESIFTRLKAYTDPVGAAIDTVNKEFTNLRKVALEAGASTGELANLEKLYNIERTNSAKEAAKSLTGSLRDLIDNINIGDSGYSLRSRLANARAAYTPLAQRVQSGDTTAYDDYSAAAQTLIDLQRQYSGSQTDYFTVLDQVKNLATKAVNDQQALIESANGSPTIFDSSPIVSATDRQTAALAPYLAASNSNEGRLIAAVEALQASGKTVAYVGRGNF